MAMFIRVDIDPAVQSDPELSQRLVDLCPVDIFRRSSDGGVETVEEHLDECTLCDLCIGAAPAQVEVIRLYRD